ncbi:STAS/SEC14 domain-containing protein [Shewanella salipaludis]|uniref:STAS/SEC14 domain-containing protein n=1 Tax=Shewanella salipaludis TaxID=2723052 RepID=A0A972JKA1_9GAMM|nr:STAS/SEC14 domain-containing protein [Shewanella salipaludis]
MTMLKHGISLGIERHGEGDFFVNIKAVGKLTHADYEYMVPMLESAIAGVKSPDIYAFLDVTEMDGWEARAMWDDLKLGLKHGHQFEKIAILGKTELQHWMSRMADWFTPIKVRYFRDETDALDWLKE